MENRKVDVEILDIYDNALSIKLPFVEVPITMNYDFFSQRVATGYFKLKSDDIKRKISKELLN